MASHNDITGDPIQTRSSSNAYRDGWERIFGARRDQALAQLTAEAQAAGAYDSEYRCDICRDTGQVGMGDDCPACKRAR